MKTVRIDIAGTHGKATLVRSEMEVVINISKVVGRAAGRIELRPVDSWVMCARANDGERWAIAERLQRRLDGAAGTRGDVDEYFRAIEMLAD